MARARTHVEIAGLDDMIRALRDLRRGGPAEARTKARLDVALHETAEASRALAHEHEGALKASMWSQVDHAEPGQWTGEIVYSARGAIFEVQRGGDHAAYIDSLTEIADPLIEDAIDSYFDGLR